jgi:hypothetical protein
VFRSLVVALGLALVVGCGSGPTLPVVTQVTIAEQTGTQATVLRPSRATLSCTGLAAAATGFLRERAPAACASAHGGVIQRVARDQRSRRVCSQVYGGPQSAHVTGTLDGKRIDLSVTRADSCGTADWRVLEPLLGDPHR